MAILKHPVYAGKSFPSIDILVIPMSRYTYGYILLRYTRGNILPRITHGSILLRYTHENIPLKIYPWKYSLRITYKIYDGLGSGPLQD